MPSVPVMISQACRQAVSLTTLLPRGTSAFQVDLQSVQDWEPPGPTGQICCLEAVSPLSGQHQSWIPERLTEILLSVAGNGRFPSAVIIIKDNARVGNLNIGLFDAKAQGVSANSSQFRFPRFWGSGIDLLTPTWSFKL